MFFIFPLESSMCSIIWDISFNNFTFLASIRKKLKTLNYNSRISHNKPHSVTKMCKIYMSFRNMNEFMKPLKYVFFSTKNSSFGMPDSETTPRLESLLMYIFFYRKLELTYESLSTYFFYFNTKPFSLTCLLFNNRNP